MSELKKTANKIEKILEKVNKSDVQNHAQPGDLGAHSNQLKEFGNVANPQWIH